MFRLADVAELLQIDVQGRSGVVVLVAAHWFTGGAVDVRQSVQVNINQDSVDGRWVMPS